MRAQLYALHVHAAWKWYVTLDVHTDIPYWFQQWNADAGMTLLEPFLSFGQALRLAQAMNQEPSVDLSRLTGRIQKAAEQCGITSSIYERLEWRQITYRNWQDGTYPGVRLDADTYRDVIEACAGRSLLLEEFQQLLDARGLRLEPHMWPAYVQLGYLNGDLELVNGHLMEQRRDMRRLGIRKQTTFRCRRCGSGPERMYASMCVYCGQECSYCEECLTMGRVRFCSLLIQGRSAEMEVQVRSAAFAAQEDFSRYLQPWGLSRAQTAASLEGLRFLAGEKPGKDPQGPRRFLIWAVTGAGKTEMIFPFIHRTIAHGGRVLLATPRKDVVLELQPRICRAFEGSSVVTLYGGSQQKWEQGQITIATTHQLLRFSEAFDLVIIDEIDAFPYHNNPMLEYAAKKVCKPGGSYMLLSATPPKLVRKAAERGQLPHVKVPVRYHRRPLPVPVLVTVPPLHKYIASGRVPGPLLQRLRASAERGAQIFVFVPAIKLVEPLVQVLRQQSWGGSSFCVEGTSSHDPIRTEKVQRFRDKEIRLLVTTTILERGVTVPKSDVFILDADSRLFDEAALVQMAGRAGRSKDDPAGTVVFAAPEQTLSQREGIRQIKLMNRTARKHGYLEEGG